MYSSSVPLDQLVGHTLGTYRIEQLLGYGNSEVACLARQQAHNQPVMLTIFTLPETFSPQARERFKTRFTEVASRVIKLQHPSIFPTYDFGEQSRYFYLVTPWVTAGSLARVLKQQSKFTLEKTQEILRQVADGLDYLHGQGITHGAFGNTNILMESEQKIQIAGVGLGSILTMRDLEHRSYPYAHLASIAGTFLGAPEYIAPEVVQGAPVDSRADIYALGAMLFEWLTGTPPFVGADPLRTALLHVQQPVPSLLSFRPDLPSTLDLVIQRALDRRPEQRYESASHLANAFERIIKVIEGVGKPASTSASLKEHLVSPEEAAVDPFVRWSTASLAALPTSSPGSQTNNSLPAQESAPLQRSPQPSVDKGRRRVMALLATGGGIAVGFFGVGDISLARSMMQQKQSQQMPGMQMNGNMPMGQMTPTAQSGPMQMASPSPAPKPSPTSTPMAMPGSTPMP